MKKDRFPQIMLIVIAVIITATVLVASSFETPEYKQILAPEVSGTVDNQEITFPILLAEEGKIDLNNATLEELMSLEYIGEARAQAIIDYRIYNIGFYAVDDILRIESIPRSVYEKIKDKVTVGTYTEVTTDEF